MKTSPRSPNHPNVYWHGDDNVGDALAGWIASAITGKPTRFTHHTWRESKVFVTGSIMSLTDETTTVWGSGIAWRDDPIHPRCRILAVRGPLTRKRAIECGADCPKVYGDPGLLLPRLYEPDFCPHRAVGIIPHFVDRKAVFNRYRGDPNVHLIDVGHSPESVLNGVASCDVIISSSLHGLVFAAAYGKPFGWVEFSDGVIGDKSKFHDFYLSIDHEPPEPLDARTMTSVGALCECVVDDPPRIDLEPLWQACPFPKRPALS